MNRPRILTRVIGHPIGTLIIVALGSLAIYQWWIGQASDLVPVIGFLAIAAAGNACTQVSEYNNWKRAWDAMGGRGPARTSSSAWRKLFGAIVWGALAYSAAVADYRTPEMRMAGGLFVLCSIGLCAAGLYGWRRERSGALGRRRKVSPVAISLPVPRASPGGKQLYRNLPDYCSRLL